MLAAALIVFRESLEAALLIGIVAAATRGLRDRERWIALGGSLGVLGAVLLALVAGRFPELFGDSGQELFNATVLGLAVLMLAWHNIWMARHGAEMVADARAVAASVREGRRTLGAVAALVGLAVLREGSETVLFLFGLASGGSLGMRDAVVGGTVGVVAGAACGYLVYAGLVRIPLRRLFSVTGWLLVLLAAGMAGQAARFLVQGDLLPPLASPLWDTSGVLPTGSAVGSALHVLIGYDAQPSGMQVAFFVLALGLIVAGSRWVRPRTTQVARRSPA